MWRDHGRRRFQGDLSEGNLKATRRQARRFARTRMRCPERMVYDVQGLFLNIWPGELPNSVRNAVMKEETSLYPTSNAVCVTEMPAPSRASAV